LQCEVARLSVFCGLVEVWQAFFDVGGEHGGDFCGDTLGFFVILDVFQPGDHAGEFRDAAYLADVVQGGEVQGAVPGDALGLSGRGQADAGRVGFRTWMALGRPQALRSMP